MNVKMNLKKMLAAVLGITMLLTGCKTSAKEEKKIMAVCAFGINSQEYVYAAGDLAEMFQDVYSNGGKLSVIKIDQNPKIIDELEYDGIKSNRFASTKENLIKDCARDAKSALGKCTAVEPEIDTIATLNLIGECFKNAGEEYGKQVVICDTGLSSAGLMNLTKKPLTEINIDAYVEFLQEQDALPNLYGVKVTWAGLGQSTQQYSSKELRILEDLYSAILDACGAEYQFSTMQPSDAVRDDLPHVTVVPVAEVPELPDDFVYDDTSGIEFLSNSNELADENKARKVLDDAVQILKNTDEAIYVTATTALFGDRAGRIERANGRANVIVKLLRELGVENNIEIVAFGSAGPFFNASKPDSAENRNVAIVFKRGKTGQKIAAGEYKPE